MRIAFPLLSLGSFGGVRKLVEIANGLVDHGHEVTLIYPEGRGSTPFFIRSEVRRLTVPGKNRLYALLRYTALLKSYDLSVLNFWPTAYLFPFTRRAIYFVQDLEYRFHSNPLFKLLAQLTYSFPITKVTYNPALARAIDTPHVIPAGVDKGVFYPDPDPALRVSERTVIMYMPRKERRKGVDIFREAIVNVSGCCEVEVWLVGGPKDILNDLPVPFRRFYPKNDAELRRLYSSADLFVLTSRSEGLGFPVMESLSCGTPVVATEVDGSEVWTLSGVVVVPVDPGAVSEGIRKVIGDTGRWKEAALKSREMVPDVGDMINAFNRILIDTFSAL